MFLLHAVPADVWQRIFLFLASDDYLRPPSFILPLILTNSHMHALLCSCLPQNAHLYAAIFQNHCDIRAPRRRLGFHHTTSSPCSTELRARFACINRIRHRSHQFLDPQILTDDLCRCFCMLMESDHKNAPLLFHYAGLSAFVLDLARDYLSETPPPLLPHSIPHLSFLLWLVWFVSTYNNLLDEDQHATNDLQERIAPYAISAWLYSDYPPKPSPFPDNSSRPFPATPTSTHYTTTMFAHTVSIKAPPVSPAAILAFCSRADACLIRWARRHTHPDPRVETAKHLLASSVAGLDTGGTDGADPSSNSDTAYSLVNHIFSTPSERFDDDWKRLLDPDIDGRAFLPPYRNPPQTHNDNNTGIYSTGTSAALTLHLLTVISGTWDGRMEYPDYRQYMSLRDALTPDIESYNNLFITSVSISCLFHVFYCVEYSDMLRVTSRTRGLEGEGDDGGVLNAWFPPADEIEMTYAGNGDLRIWDRKTTTLASYKRFYPTHHLPPETAEKILDIIVIGTNISPDPGLAAQYTGRITKDGMIVMVRDGLQRGKELLRGYVHHGRNFVGRWRTTAGPADSSSWEGPFMMARMED